MNRGISITQYHTSHPWKSRGLLCPCLGQEGRDWGCHTQTLYPHNSGYLDLAAHFGKCSRSAHLSRSNSRFELAPSIQDSHRSWKEKKPTKLGRKIMQILRERHLLFSFICNTVGPQQIEQRDRQQQLQFFIEEKSPAVSLRSTLKFSFPFALSIC